MNEPKASPVSSPVSQGGLDMGQPRPPQPWPPSSAPFLGQDPVPGRLLHRGLLSPHPLPPPLPSPRAQPPPRSCRPRPVSPGAAGAAERARGRGRLCGRKMVFSQLWLIPTASTAPLPVLHWRENRVAAVQHPSGFWGWGWWWGLQLPPKWGSCSPSTALLSSTLQPTCMEGNVRHQAGGDVMPRGLLAWDGQGGSGHQDGWVMLCLPVVDY